MEKSVTMTVAEWQTLVNLLGAKCLFSECAGLIGKIMQQMNGPAPPANGEARPQPQAPNG